MSMVNSKNTKIQPGIHNVLFGLCILGLLLGFAMPAFSATISGTVSLPSGTASEDITVSIKAECIDLWDLYEDEVTISSGTNSVAFSITVPEGNDKSRVIVYQYSGNDYVAKGYYSTSGTTWKNTDATHLPGGQNHSNVNLTLLRGKTLSGNVSLPAGDTLPSGEQLDVSIRITQPGVQGYGYGFLDTLNWSASQNISITSSQPQPQFSIRVPDDANLSYIVGYLSYWNNNYFSYGYYAGSSNPTSWIEADAENQAGGQDHSNINLTLIRAKTISGQLSLPTGDTAPENMCFAIKAKSNQGVISDGLQIPQNSNQGDYSVKIPEDSSESWKISYDELQSCDFFFPTDYTYWGVGFYSGTALNTTVLHEADAEQLSGEEDHTGINMTVFEGKTVTGSISLPDNKNATHDMKLFIRAEISGSSNHDQMKEGFGYGYGTPMTYDENSVYNTITIRQGQSTSRYTLTISPESNITWNVFYSCLEGCNSNYDSPGYYNTSATTSNLTNATPLAGGADHSDINLTLLEKKGMLSFPVRSKDGQISIISM